jgi:hypothetical protein
LQLPPEPPHWSKTSSPAPPLLETVPLPVVLRGEGLGAAEGLLLLPLLPPPLAVPLAVTRHS